MPICNAWLMLQKYAADMMDEYHSCIIKSLVGLLAAVRVTTTPLLVFFLSLCGASLHTSGCNNLHPDWRKCIVGVKQKSLAVLEYSLCL